MRRPKSLLRTVLEPLAAAVALALLARGAMHIYAIPSSSMAPTLEPGDQIVVTRYVRSDPQRGQVVVFRSPVDETELVVKRVVGVPGDLVDSRLGRLRVGGYTLPEPYVQREATTGAIQSQVIPGGCYYVLGDNREDSLDSRSWGVVPRERIVGRARLVLWSSSGAASANEPALADAGALTRAAARSGRARIFKWIE